MAVTARSAQVLTGVLDLPDLAVQAEGAEVDGKLTIERLVVEKVVVEDRGSGMTSVGESLKRSTNKQFESRYIHCIQGEGPNPVADANGLSWREGQRVAGFVYGTKAGGAYAEYLVAESSLV